MSLQCVSSSNRHDSFTLLDSLQMNTKLTGHGTDTTMRLVTGTTTATSNKAELGATSQLKSTMNEVGSFSFINV